MIPIDQSTAYNATVLMVDNADGKTGKTGLTLTIELQKNGGAFASISPTVTERAYGWYTIALTSSHTDTIGDLVLHVSATGADPSDPKYYVRLPVLSGVIENGKTLTECARLWNSAAAGKVSGLPTAPVFRDLADTKNRITATTDSNGNRSIVTTDVS